MKIKCSKCGLMFSVTKERLQKRLQQFNVNSVEELEKVYVCRECRKKQKAEKPKSVAEMKK
jgi:DNA-directed RNA polymerase subunit RPC12/RpoP